MLRSFIKFGLLWVALAIALLWGSAVMAQDRAAPPAKAAAQGVEEGALPAPLSGFKDEGVLLLYVNEDRLGSFVFKWQPDGHIESKYTLSMAGQTVVQTARIAPDKEGRWQRIT